MVVLIPLRRCWKAEAAFKKADDIWNLRKDDYFVNDEARARYWDDREKARLALEAAERLRQQEINRTKMRSSRAIPKRHG
ncbi:hypothetical protein ECZU12_49090 [Escherichia coli]|nr:hypothetical protein ECZU12_49090 [Escherichia coli]